MGRFKYAYNSFSYYGEPIERSIERVARLGYDAIELVGEPAQYDGPRVRKLAADAGIAVSSISSMYTADRDLCHPEPDRRRGAVDYVRAVADLAAATGADTIIVAPSAVMKTIGLAPPADEWKWATESIRAGGEYAATVGVDVSLEPWNRYETYFLNRLEQAVELWRATGLRNGGVMGDTFHRFAASSRCLGRCPPATSRSTSRETRPARTSASSPRPHCRRTEWPVS